jgi:hypothetical protein
MSNLFDHENERSLDRLRRALIAQPAFQLILLEVP